MTLQRQGGEFEPPLQSACPSHEVGLRGFSLASPQCSRSVVGNPWMWMADCMYCSMAILYKGFAHLKIIVSTGVLGPILHGYQGTVVKFVGSQKLYADF